MGHSSEIISVDVYGDNAEIIGDCLNELEPFIKLVQPNDEDEFGDECLADCYLFKIKKSHKRRTNV